MFAVVSQGLQVLAGLDPVSPAAPGAAGAKVQTALSYGMYFVLAACAASFMYGAAEFGWARKRNRHGEMNEGKAVCGWSLAGAAVASMAIALVNLAFS